MLDQTSDRPRAKRMPAEDRRRQILDAAISVFARVGYHEAGTADIAAAAEIGEPTIYRYYDGKKDLYDEAVRRCRMEITENWQRIIDTSENAREALDRIGTWYFQEIKRSPDLLVLRFRALIDSTDSAAAEAVRETYVRNKGLVRGLYEMAKADGGLRADADTDALAWLFMAIGSIIDVTHLLGLEDDFGVQEIMGIRELIVRAAWNPD